MIEHVRQTLRGYLRACERRYNISASEAFERLTKVPAILLLSRGDIVDPQLSMQARLTSDAKATLLRAWQKNWGQIATARWDQLDKKERRSAKKFTALLDKQQFFPRQRPSKIDYRVALYLMFTFESLIGSKFPFSRPASGGNARGPAFEALRISIGLAQWRLCGSPFKTPEHFVPKPEALADFVRVTRTQSFRNLMRQRGLSRTPECVISSGEVFALTVADARKKMRTGRRKPLKSAARRGTY